MTPKTQPFLPFDCDLEDIATILGKKVSAIHQAIYRGTLPPDLPIYNVGTSGKGKRYAARASEVYAWLESRKGGRR